MMTIPPSTKVNIDGDVVVYSVGFAAEMDRYLVEDGKLFEDENDALRYCERYDLPTPTKVKIPEPLEYCLHSVKKLIERIVEGAKAEEYEVFLTGDGNFREEVATFQPYKGNRENAPKPVHYDAIREHLLNEHHGRVVVGQEADDALSILAWTKNETIASIDKDLDNTPGWHYNWQKERLYFVGEREAWENFHIQLLTGDATDHIPGLFKFTGCKAMQKLKDRVLEQTSPLAMFEEVVAIYCEAVEKKELEYDEQGVRRFLFEIGQLLWMRREPGQMFSMEIYKNEQ